MGSPLTRPPWTRLLKKRARPDIPEEQKEVTAILVLMKSPGVTPGFYHALNEGTKAQAVNPIDQMRWLKDNVLGNVGNVLKILTSLIIVVSGIISLRRCANSTSTLSPISEPYCSSTNLNLSKSR